MIDFVHLNLDRLAVRTALAIGDREGNARERIRALRLGRCPAERPGVRIERRAGRHAARTERECVGRQVRIRRRNRERERRAFVHRPVADRPQHRIEVHFSDRNADRLAVVQLRRPVVGDHHIEGEYPRPLGFGRRPGKHPGCWINRCPRRGCPRQAERGRLPRIHIAHRCRKSQRLQFIDDLIPDRSQHRRIVHRRNCECHRRRRRATPSVAQRIAKAVAPVEVQVRLIGEAAVARQGHDPMDRLIQQRHAQRIVIYIAVVRQHPLRRQHGQQRILGCCIQAVGPGDRIVVLFGCHADGDGLAVIQYRYTIVSHRECDAGAASLPRRRHPTEHTAVRIEGRSRRQRARAQGQ